MIIMHAMDSTTLPLFVAGSLADRLRVVPTVVVNWLTPDVLAVPWWRVL